MLFSYSDIECVGRGQLKVDGKIDGAVDQIIVGGDPTKLPHALNLLDSSLGGGNVIELPHNGRGDFDTQNAGSGYTLPQS